MWLLAVTVCISNGQDAACHRHVRLTDTILECRQIGAAMKDYIAEADGVLFIGFSCRQGMDG